MTALQIDRTVIVDAGAAIRLQRLEQFGNEFYTTEEVYHEIKDRRARQHLTTMPFELKIRQPSKDDFLHVKEFARQTGDLGSLSTNDMGLIALAVKIHRENGGDPLRTSPEAADVVRNHVPFSWAPREETARSSRSRAFGGGSDGLESVGGATSTADFQSLVSDEEDFEDAGEEKDRGLCESIDEGDHSGVEAAEGTPEKDTYVEGDEDKTMFEVEQSSGAASSSSSSAVLVPTAPAPPVVEPAVVEKEPEIDLSKLTWAERAALAKNKQPTVTEVKKFVTPEPVPLESPLSHLVENLPTSLPAQLMDSPRQEISSPGGPVAPPPTPGAVSTTNASSTVSTPPYSAAPLSGGESCATPTSSVCAKQPPLTAVKNRLLEDVSPAPAELEEPKSKILSSVGGVTVEIVEEESDTSSDEDGWVTSENIRRMNCTVEKGPRGGHGGLDEDESSKTALLSTDYSVQNVAIQMGLQGLSIDGFKIRSVKMWAKICRGCFHSTRDTTKVYCPKCGNPTLDRVPITLGADGQPILHDNRRRKPNLRGTIYSIPKRRGGRKDGDILLREDERMMGSRQRQAYYEQKIAEKQKQLRANAEDAVDAWCTRHITGTGKTINRNPHQLQHGYGRRNPNQGNFKSQKFKQ